MTELSRAEFIAAFTGRELDLRALQDVEELRGLDPRAADLDHNGRIEGAEEAGRLYDRLDAFEHQLGRPQNGRGAISYTRTLLALTHASPTTQAERAGQRMAEGGRQAMDRETEAHRQAVTATGIGRYYGDHSSFKHMSSAERAEWIKHNAEPGTNPQAPRESSCIGWAMQNVKAGYEAAGKGDRWRQIERTVYANGSKGTVLAAELQKDGWKGIYFNPDTKHPNDGSAEHTITARNAANGKPYYGIRVDGEVINYHPSDGSTTAEDTSGLDKLRQIPFYFGIARGGQHTFVGGNGKISEFHWMAEPNDPNAITNPSLKDFAWNSGIIMVPPGTWPR